MKQDNKLPRQLPFSNIEKPTSALEKVKLMIETAENLRLQREKELRLEIEAERIEVRNSHLVSKKSGTSLADAAQMTLWPVEAYAMPGVLNKSSLFAPGNLRNDTPVANHRLETPDSVIAFYHGQLLSENDASVYMELLRMARTTPIGDPVIFSGAQMLRRLGMKSDGADNYNNLHNTLMKLSKCTVSLKIENVEERFQTQVNEYIKEVSTGDPKKKKTKPNAHGVEAKTRINATKDFRLLTEYQEIESETSTGLKERFYSIVVPETTADLFLTKDFALLDSSTRKKLGNMAMFLHRQIVVSSSATRTFKLDRLKNLACYRGPDRKFRASLEKAAKECEEKNLISGFKIEERGEGEWYLECYQTRMKSLKNDK
jgi:hypothetical protein